MHGSVLNIKKQYPENYRNLYPFLLPFEHFLTLILDTVVIKRVRQ